MTLKTGTKPACTALSWKRTRSWRSWMTPWRSSRSASFAYIKSEVELTQTEYDNKVILFPDTPKSRPL